MAARQGFTASRYEKAMSPASPNAVTPAITVELRVHWPARMGHEAEVLRLIEETLVEAREKLAAATFEPTEHARAIAAADEYSERIARLRAGCSARRAITDAPEMV